MTNYRTIRFEMREAVGILTLNRPARLNALNRMMLEEIDDVLQSAEARGCRALLLTGAGRAFCSGADLTPGEWGDAAEADIDAGLLLEQHLNPLLKRWFALPFPVISAINGPAAGAGCSLAIAADIAIADENAVFLQAFSRIGLVPDMGSTWMLPRLVGRARAAAMMLLGDPIKAREALEWGLIYQTTATDTLLPQAIQIAERLASGPTAALALIRQGLHDCMELPLDEALNVERRNQRKAGLTSDFIEGIAAFNEKRRPRFIGR